ncbi:AAA family ATPase [Microgenomates group bacterium]|nr:AAA family ATPase [Microgenomates group bacterium]
MSQLLLRQLWLTNWRKFDDYLWEVQKPVSLFCAPNASGKTSILEAIGFLSSSGSFRDALTPDLINFDKELSRIAAVIQQEGKPATDRLEIMLTRGQVNGKRTNSKLYSLNFAGKRKKDFIGQFGAVIFCPEDMRLIEGSPHRRRRWMNYLLATLDDKYAQALKNYEAILLRRNKLLSDIKDQKQGKEALSYYNQGLLKYGMLLQQKRADLAAFCSQLILPLDFNFIFEPSLINEERLSSYLDKEYIVGHTLIGPQKDDFHLQYNFAPPSQPARHLNIATFGSRGQQRLGVLYLKLCELKFNESVLSTRVGENHRPLLLLDDIFSELDESAQKLVISLMEDYQTILTTAQEATKELLVQALPDNRLEVVDLAS